MLTKLQIRALLLGFLAYIGAFVIASVLLTVDANLRSGTGSSSGLFWLVFWLGGIFMFSAGGFVAGWIAGERGLLHGFVVGLLGALSIGGAIELLLFSSSFEIGVSVVIGYLLPSAVLTTMGGGIGELFKRRRQSRAVR